ncbi:TetR/AcrR family transcriptional regulator [Vagococcus carniphilus]|uniref:TetR/AcrR family transcriptional regulator n=1 Tax=Vagococcus carniphilus TaxID=218144 RepID=UPI002890079B|nr:TetR/AcrR family transcriptional regulator [Vagococcus carniphilus]MDT2813544.1 TetR/AcrR family transcriptional regulator [Vagococcus carniphilus]MDT2850137.1 TetR/AcrR family transcriptional regulator [Vagococcus carniphilus]MDT2865658.1 TetR/AcrR family transcriptional regulator [Vagococcus carniphilus]
MGVRETKKKELQEKILKAAKELFLEEEFDQVTMSKIAKRAGVGLGTAYNYYASKEELYLVAGGTAYILGAESDIDNVPFSVEELINTLVNEIKKMTGIEKNSWRVSLSSLTKAAEKKPSLFLELIEIDHLFIEKVEEAINKLQTKGDIKADVSVSLLVELIYDAIFTSLLFYFYNEEETVEELSNKLSDKLSMLLKI